MSGSSEAQSIRLWQLGAVALSVVVCIFVMLAASNLGEVISCSATAEANGYLTGSACHDRLSGMQFILMFVGIGGIFGSLQWLRRAMQRV